MTAALWLRQPSPEKFWLVSSCINVGLQLTSTKLSKATTNAC